MTNVHHTESIYRHRLSSVGQGIAYSAIGCAVRSAPTDFDQSFDHGAVVYRLHGCIIHYGMRCVR